MEAAISDPSEIVRHESAAALGAIGDEKTRRRSKKRAGMKVTKCEVRGIASLFNLDFMKFSSRRPKPDTEKISAKDQGKEKERI